MIEMIKAYNERIEKLASSPTHLRYLHSTNYSKEPVALCSAVIYCATGNGNPKTRYCYFKSGCSAKVKLGGGGEMVDEEKDLLDWALSCVV